MKTLSASEEEQAKRISIWQVAQMEPSPHLAEWRRTRPMTKPPTPILVRTVSYHLTRASADEDQERRGGPPGDESAGFEVWRATLLEAFERGGFSVEEVHTHLAYELAPLTDEETERAARTRIWTVWYEDRFHVGADRDAPVAVAHFLTREEAEREAESRGGQGELAGYDVGHATVLESLRSGVLREIGDARRLLQRSRPREREMLTRVRELLAREVGDAAKGEVAVETRLVADLGLSGRNGARVMAAFFSEFGVDPEGFEVTHYFAAELIGLFGKTVKLMQAGRPEIDITVDDLLTAAMLGRWTA